MKHLFSISVLALFLSSGCGRDNPEGYSRVMIQTPTLSELRGKVGVFNLPSSSEFKVCMGVHVTGSGISSSRANSCSPEVGLSAGFVEAGQAMSLTIPKGNGRNFSLLVYVAQLNESCPGLTSSILGSPIEQFRSFQAGAKTGVNLSSDNENVTIDLLFPGLSAPLGSSATGVCLPTPVLRGELNSNGATEGLGSTKNVALSSPIFQSIFNTDFGNASGAGALSSSGILSNLDNSLVKMLPAYIKSVTRKPDLGQYYGIDEAGQIYSLDLNSSLPTATGLNAASCPFAVTGCKVPVWLQSISAGYGNRLYGLDHAGQIYSLEGANQFFITSVDPFVSQVVFY